MRRLFTFRHRIRSWRVLGLLALLPIGLPLLWASDTTPEADFTPRKCDPAAILGPDTCLKCHESESKQWMMTPHYRTFDTLHRTPEAKAIAERLGLRSIKRDPTCVSCHYTPQLQGTRERLVAGVSCESCHGGHATGSSCTPTMAGLTSRATPNLPSIARRVAARAWPPV